MKKILVTAFVMSIFTASASFADSGGFNYQLPGLNYSALGAVGGAYGAQPYGLQQNIDQQQNEQAKKQWMQNHPESDAKIKQREQLRQQWAQNHPNQYQPAPAHHKHVQKPDTESS